MRYPAVSGSFYTSSVPMLRAEVKECLAAAKKQVAQKERLAIVCPHAGYMYSGKCAAFSYASCSNWGKKGLTAIIIGPNHTGLGTPISVSFDDWKTPIGEIKTDVGLADAIVKAGKIARRDELGHLREHSVEVQLPFLQEVCPDASIVAICMGMQELSAARDLGNAIYGAVTKLKRNAIVIASSDFTHYEPAEEAKKKDTQAIERLLLLDEPGFERIVKAHNLSICGHSPIATAVNYARKAGAKKCELLKYTNSGEATGDYDSVVAYASFAISK
ncbi:Memo-like protein [uncultured archaeon]|nr:Memo-like protein [uncultured archaeon]